MRRGSVKSMWLVEVEVRACVWAGQHRSRCCIIRSVIVMGYCLYGYWISLPGGMEGRVDLVGLLHAKIINMILFVQKDVFMQLLIHAAMKSSNPQYHTVARLSVYLSLYVQVYCLSNAMHGIGQNIKSLDVYC